MARLDRLAPVKELAQIGAAIGREFSLDLLAKVAAIPADELDRSLSTLQEAGLMFRHGAGPRGTISFKHALVQEAAYESLLKSPRQRIHARIATVLQKSFSDFVRLQPEVLAHHLTEAGLIEQAIDAWHAAGRSAAQRSAILEACAHLERGLALLQCLPESKERDRKELSLEALLSALLIGAKGWGNLQTLAAFERLGELGTRLGDQDAIFRSLYGRFVHNYAGSADIPTARRLAEEWVGFAERSENSWYLDSGRRFLGYTLCAQGELRRGTQLVESSLQSYDRGEAKAYIARYGQDPWVSVKSRQLTHATWMLGFPEQARVSAQAAIEYARDRACSLTPVRTGQRGLFPRSARA